ncbi:glycosyl hydrolase family 28-related protein [Peribacillus simplex]|uniref:glycosyl hydrolase family 28-related protein n=1 Tax=Peribacillus simplex TaxID=1478 RepID=UPI003D2DEBF6
MKRRNLLRKTFLFIIAFFFGYTVKKEGEDMLLQRVDSTTYRHKDLMLISEEIKNLREKSEDTAIDLSERGINVKKFGAKGDGVTDDTLAVKNAIKNVGPYSTIYFPKGVYIINNLTINDSIHFIGVGGDVIFKRTLNNIILSTTITVKNIELENITFDGDSIKKTGVSVSFHKLFIKKCTFKNCGIPGYKAGNMSNVDGMRISGIEADISNCLFNRNERDGLFGSAVETLRVSNCKFNDNGRFASANDGGNATKYFPKNTIYMNNYVNNCGSGGLHVEGLNKSTFYSKVVFVGNIIDNCGGDSWGFGWGIVAGINTEGTASGNIITNFNLNNNPSLSAFPISTKIGEWSINGNSFRKCKGIVINSNQSGVDYPLVITGNSFKDCGTALNIYQHHNVVFTANRTEKMELHGLNVDFCDNTIINGNIILNSSDSSRGEFSGVYLSRATFPTVTGNIINGMKQKYGIEIPEGTDTTNINFGLNHINSFVTAWSNIAEGSSQGYSINQKRIFYATTIPTTGKFLKGDIIYNTNPFASGKIGWICIAAGKFGNTDPIFKLFGEIDP